SFLAEDLMGLQGQLMMCIKQNSVIHQFFFTSNFHLKSRKGALPPKRDVAPPGLYAYRGSTPTGALRLPGLYAHLDFTYLAPFYP
ncbi:MAG: hypothetical protein KAI96_05335, partial [Thermodesulfovibrionia bacterium]|nr:hypothetical protein [Thermodesulfovibrionia bacterium]